MTDVLFITATSEMALKEEVNGTMILATKLLQVGFDVRILRFGQIKSNNKNYKDFIKEITEEIIRIAPKCVSFYTLWPYYHIMLRIAKELKEKDSRIITILGGPQASATADMTMRSMDYVDYISTGEGEKTIVPFIETLLKKNGEGVGEIPGLYYREGNVILCNHTDMPLCNLEEIPFWDERLYCHDYKAEANIQTNKYFMPIDAGRGCPYNCTFCCTSHFWRRTYRLKSAERIIKDIRHFKQYGIKSFWFSHDAFTANKRLVEEVCDRIIEEDLNIKWKCTSRIDCITEELILKMKQAGMIQIELGIETGSARMQKLIKKNLNLAKAKELISFLQRNGIYIHLFFMYGFPDETEADLEDSLNLLFSLYDMGVQRADMSFCKFAPATAITEKHYNQLELDSKIKILTRGMAFGYEEELPVIRENKALFPFFYHLSTPVRNEYQYVQLLAWIYERLPNSIKYLRKLYKGDNISFYKDFYQKNADVFERDIDSIVVKVREDTVRMLGNMLEGFDVPYKRQLKSLICFDYNVQMVSRSKEDIEIRQTYDFRYVDVKLKQPIEKYAQGQTEILLRKKDGKMEIKILQNA